MVLHTLGLPAYLGNWGGYLGRGLHDIELTMQTPWLW